MKKEVMSNEEKEKGMLWTWSARCCQLAENSAAKHNVSRKKIQFGRENM
jgi:hypothetical protein